MNGDTIVKLVLAFLGSLNVPSVIALWKAFKAKVLAKTEAEKEKANNDMREQAETLILEAEQTYADVNTILKANGKSAGAMKKQSVMSALQQYASEKGYIFDKEYWSDKVEEVVNMTKQVNK